MSVLWRSYTNPIDAMVTGNLLFIVLSFRIDLIFETKKFVWIDEWMFVRLSQFCDFVLMGRQIDNNLDLND